MYKIVDGKTRGLKDVGKFISAVNENAGLFNSANDIFIARAPGRLDVMGGIADYSGSLVLELPIAEATIVAVQKSDDQKIKIVSIVEDTELTFKTELAKLRLDGLGYRDIQNVFAGQDHWAAYVAGVFPVLEKELKIDLHNGARIFISSDIPIGKGVSSSAAIEVATMQAVCMAFDIEIAPRELALLCQKLENEIVGAPCGVMDQVAAHCGAENTLISLLCQPAEIRGTVSIPRDVEFWGIDSGVRHSVVGSDYSSVRIGAFMGYRIIADIAGLTANKIGDGLVSITDNRWHGYLANISPEEYEINFASAIPDAITGSDFLARYGGTTDTVTRVAPSKTYAVKAPTAHGIYENSRVYAFSALLPNVKTEEDLDTLGALMFASHTGYATCGLTEDGTDRLVELVRANRDRGLSGARITGGGSGGTVSVLARAGSEKVIKEIAARYKQETGREPYIFHGSSPGCEAFGHIRLARA